MISLSDCMGTGRIILGVAAILIAVVATFVGSFTRVIAYESEQWYDENCGVWGLGSAEDCSEIFDAFVQFRTPQNKVDQRNNNHARVLLHL